MKRHWLCLLAAVCVTLAAAGCSARGGADPSQAHGGSQPTAGSQPPAAPPADATDAPKKDLNSLTGVMDLERGADTRPVAVMIGNNDKSRPQVGLDAADMFVEAETEGGITRIMAIFANAARVPAQLGPVRSARSPFALLSGSLDAVYVHAGGSTAGLQTIKTAKVTDINALAYDGTTFWRDAALRKSKGLEYSMLTGGKKLAARMKSAKIRGTSDRKAPFSFGESTGSGAGQAVQITFSGAQIISFKYDASTGLYQKGNGRLGAASAHKTAAGVQLSASNILVMYDQKFDENSTTIGFKLKSGSGLLVSGGASRGVKWSRSASRLSFTEADGSAMKAAPGKTYLCLVSSSSAGETAVQ